MTSFLFTIFVSIGEKTEEKNLDKHLHGPTSLLDKEQVLQLALNTLDYLLIVRQKDR